MGQKVRFEMQNPPKYGRKVLQVARIVSPWRQGSLSFWSKPQEGTPGPCFHLAPSCPLLQGPGPGLPEVREGGIEPPTGESVGLGHCLEDAPLGLSLGAGCALCKAEAVAWHSGVCLKLLPLRGPRGETGCALGFCTWHASPHSVGAWGVVVLSPSPRSTEVQAGLRWLLLGFTVPPVHPHGTL